MTRNSIALAIAAVLAGGSAASAGEAQDRIFRTGLLGEVAVGEAMIFDLDLRANDAEPSRGSVEVAVITGEAGRRVARVDWRQDGRPASEVSLPADGGHPVLLMFLETTLRAMAEATGGSPFYIRNRIREALGADVPLEPVELVVEGDPAAGEAMTFRPFTADPHRAAMGGFADLAITVTASDAVPGGLARFESKAGDAFAETVTFSRIQGRP